MVRRDITGYLGLKFLFPSKKEVLVLGIRDQHQVLFSLHAKMGWNLLKAKSLWASFMRGKSPGCLIQFFLLMHLLFGRLFFPWCNSFSPSLDGSLVVVRFISGMIIGWSLSWRSLLISVLISLLEKLCNLPPFWSLFMILFLK